MPRYAAFDIGSNSVRMMAADVDAHGRFDVLASERQVTRLGAGVFRNGLIEPATLDSLCEVLARMNERVRPLSVLSMRAVATAAVRDASNADEFIERVSAVLGQNVEVISGQEEAPQCCLLGAQHWKVIRVDVSEIHTEGRAVRVHGASAPSAERESLEGFPMLHARQDLISIGVRDEPHVREIRPEHHQATVVRMRLLKERLVENAEEGRGAADAQGEGEDHRRNEAWRAAEGPEGDA